MKYRIIAKYVNRIANLAFLLYYCLIFSVFRTVQLALKKRKRIFVFKAKKIQFKLPPNSIKKYP